MADTTEKTVAEELREAAAGLRANPQRPVDEPLASWLESAAWVAREHPQDPDYAGLPETKFCTECNDEETTCVAFVDHALAVARVLNGTSQEVDRG
ncbi:hypothetical protein [Nonomuraea sp. NPDC050643]|uniref:hypothetical protein n=1 Tax=Nonomuraea sp. NPDC050643 TaxID=3155660 RepID=UPI0033E0DD32